MKEKKGNVKGFRDGEFKLKTSVSGQTVFVEGFANKAVADRVGDIIPGEAWNLDNFQKNPVLLFNHDKDFPIGRVLEAEKRDDGLWIKAQISRSKGEKMSFVRDMIKENILATFSVGFDPGEEVTNDKGHNEIKSAELLEVSVVTVPMNQDSTFSASVKDWKGKKYKDVKEGVLSDKRNWYLNLVEERMALLEGTFKGFRATAIPNIAKALKITEGELKKTLIVEHSDQVSEDFIKELFEALGGSDLGELEKFGHDDEKPDDEDDEEDDDKGVHAEGEDDEDDEEDDKEKTDDDQKQDDMKECVAAKIPKLIAEGKDQDEAVAIAMQMCSDDGKCCTIEEVTKETKLALLAMADRVANGESLDKQALADGETDNTAAIPKENSEFDQGQPHIELAKQSNILLSTLVTELQNLNKNFILLSELVSKAQGTALEQAQDDDNDAEENSDDDEDKSSSGHETKAKENIAGILKKHGL